MLALLLGIATAQTTAPQVELVDRPGNVTEASIVVDAPPDEVYRVATDYANWPANFTDATNVKVLSGERVQFHSRALGHTVTVAFENIPNQAIRFRGIEGPPGGRAHGEYRIEPIDGGRRSRITASLYLDVVGAPGLFVRQSKIRAMRHDKLTRDLGDIARWAALQHPHG